MPEHPSQPYATGPSAPEPLLKRATSGYRTTLISQGVRLCCKAASVVVLARIVSPEDHGRFAMAASVFYALILLRDAGMGTAATQARELSPIQLATLFWGHLVLGVILAAVSLAAAPFAAHFYATPEVGPLLAWMSITFVVIGAGGFARAQLARLARFTEVNALENKSFVAGTIAMIGTGIAGGGAYAFAAYLLVSELIATVFAWRSLEWRPRTAPVWGSLRGLLRTGANITLYQGITFVLLQIDSIVVGRLFGSQLLGFYNRANQILALPNAHVATPLGQVSLVTLSRLTSESAHFERHAWKTLTTIAHLVLLLFAICIAMPEETIRLLLGNQWPEAAPLMRVLAIGAAASTLTTFGYSINVALGRTTRLIAPSLISLPITFGAVWLGSRHGVLGVATGISIVNVTLAVPKLWWVLNDLDGGFSEYGKALIGPLVTMVLTMAGMWAGRELVHASHWFLRLAVGGASGLLVLALLTTTWPKVRREAFAVLEYLPLPNSWRKKDPA